MGLPAIVSVGVTGHFLDASTTFVRMAAAIYAFLHPLMLETVLTWGDFGRITLPGLLGLSHWIVMAILIALVLALFRWFERLKV